MEVVVSKMVSLRLDEGLIAWLDSYAEKRGVSRTQLLESAVVEFKDDCERGVPDLKRASREYREALAPGAGECCCPVLEGPKGEAVRGFRQTCPVHGGRSRADFARLTGLRGAMFTRRPVDDSTGHEDMMRTRQEGLNA